MEEKKPPVIRTEHLTYTYGLDTPLQKTAVDDFNIEIAAGEFVGIIGHTGSGKSTLIQHLNGLLKPTSGKVYIDGEDIWADPKNIRRFRFKVGLVFQYPEYQLFEETVYKDVAFGPKNMGLSDEEIDRRVRSACAFVGLKEKHLERSPFDLSGGQKRRVAIAGVIAMDPEVLILDEPTAGLDPKGRDMILGQIKKYHQEKKNTVLLVSHNMEDIARYATRVLVLNGSKVFMYDTPEKVFMHAEEIGKIGLTVPSVTKVFTRLAAMGYPVNPAVYTPEQAAEEIRRVLALRK